MPNDKEPVEVPVISIKTATPLATRNTKAAAAFAQLPLPFAP